MVLSQGWKLGRGPWFVGPVLAGLAVAILIGAGYESFVLGVGFVALFFGICVWDVRFLIHYYLLFGAVSFPSLFDRVFGAVSLNWLRTTVLAGIYLIYAAGLMFVRSRARLAKVEVGFVLVLLAWIGYLGLSIGWALSPPDSMRYYPKFVMAGALAVVVLLEDRISVERAWNILFVGALVFMSVTLLAAPFKSALWPQLDSPYLEGISGRHQSKYYLVLVAIMGLAGWFNRRRLAASAAVFLLALLLLFGILERGAFLALIAGSVAALLSALRGGRRASAGVWFAAVVAVLSAGFLLFFTPEFNQYMFVAGSGPRDFFGRLFSGDVLGALDIVQFKGRLEYWSAILSRVPATATGVGFGSTAVLVGRIFGEYNELHSDIVQYWLETGYVGYALYLAMWTICLWIGWRARRSQDQLSRTIAFTLIGYTVALVVWSFVDHVMDYTHVSGAFLFVVAALLLRRTREMREGETLPTQVTLASSA